MKRYFNLLLSDSRRTLDGVMSLLGECFPDVSFVERTSASYAEERYYLYENATLDCLICINDADEIERFQFWASISCEEEVGARGEKFARSVGAFLVSHGMEAFLAEEFPPADELKGEYLNAESHGKDDLLT